MAGFILSDQTLTKKAIQKMKNKFLMLLFGAFIGVGVWSVLAFSDRDATKDIVSVDLTEARVTVARAVSSAVTAA